MDALIVVLLFLAGSLLASMWVGVLWGLARKVANKVENNGKVN